ncbi:MAG: hypothetical protein ABIP64_18725 [Burkholderiales bacterium]
MALSSVYNLLRRHGWRKRAPDTRPLSGKRPPQSDPAAQDAWKKLPEILADLIHAWPDTHPVKPMFQDEARFGRINDVRRCWAPKPVRPLCRAMLTHEYTYAYGEVDGVSGKLDSLILPHVNTECMPLFLDAVGVRHPACRIIMGLDGAGGLAGALNPPHNMKRLTLPPYAPNSIRSNLSGTSRARNSFPLRLRFYCRAGSALQISLLALETD